MFDKIEKDLNIELTDREIMILNYYNKLLEDKINNNNKIITKVIKREYPQLKSRQIIQVATESAKSQDVFADCKIVDYQSYMFSPTIYNYLIKLTGRQEDVEVAEKYFLTSY